MGGRACACSRFHPPRTVDSRKPCRSSVFADWPAGRVCCEARAFPAGTAGGLTRPRPPHNRRTIGVPLRRLLGCRGFLGGPTLNSVVCIAQVPDTESRIKIGADGRHIDEAGLKFIVSPYDEFALEEAIRLKEKSGGDVTVVGFGPDRVQQAPREGLAPGATHGLHVQRRGARAGPLGIAQPPHVKGEVADADSLGIAMVLAAAIKSVPHDVVFFGKQGVGTDNSLVGPMVAELLGYPQVNVVTHLDAGDGKLTAHRELEGAEDVVEAALPAVITAQKGLNEPRYASLKGIMAAKKIAIDAKSVGDLGLSGDDIYNQRVKIVSLELPPEKSGGRKIDGGDAAAAAKEIVKYIREEAKAL